MGDSSKLFALAGVVAALAVLGVLALLLGGRADEEPAGAPAATSGPAAGPARPSPGAEAGELARRVEALERDAERRETRVRELEEENRALKAEAARRPQTADPSAAAGDPGAGGGAAPDPRKKAYRFGLKGKTPVLDEADWGALAVQFSDLKKALPAVIEEFSRTGTVSFKTQMEMQEKNQPLAIFTVKASGEAKGMAMNSTFTHPAVVASMVRALLEAAGLPLSAVQDEAARAAGESWAKREEARVAGYPPETLKLQKLVEEVESRQRFIDDLKSFLSAGQQAALFDPATEGRAGIDLLSPALNLAMRTPVTEPTREELEKALVRESFKVLGIERDPAAFAWLGAEWVGSLPEACLPLTEEKFRTDAAFPPLSKLLRCARAQLAVLKRLIERENFDEPTLQKIRNLTLLAVPQVVLAPEKKEGEGK